MQKSIQKKILPTIKKEGLLTIHKPDSLRQLVHLCLGVEAEGNKTLLTVPLMRTEVKPCHTCLGIVGVSWQFLLL